MGTKSDIYLIPDTQAKPGVQNPLIPIAHHIAELKPKTILHGGDHWDFPSLSQYDKGKKSHRVRTYLDDVRSGNRHMQEFWAIIKKKWRNWKRSDWIMLRGNHEHRRAKAIEYGPDELIGLMHEFPLDYSNWDKVVPFLKEITIQNITFCHYFQQDNSAGAISSARALLNKRHASCVAFHKQGYDYAEALSTNGRRIQAIIAGSCYYHDESYKAHTNHHWRGSILLTNIDRGMYDFHRYSLQSLHKRYCK